MQLRPRQVKAYADLQTAYREGFKSPILRASTGFGKSHSAVDIMRNAAARGKRVWFSAHLDLLLRDASKRLTKYGVPHAWICAGFPMALKHQVQVVSVETLRRRIEKIPPQYYPDLLIIDEGHIGVDRTMWIQQQLEVKHSLILTATPILLNGDGLGKIADTIIETGQTSELIDEGLLCKIRYFAPTRIDTSQLHVRMGEYKSDEVEEIVTRRSLIGDVVKYYREKAHGRPAVAFCHSLKHAAEVSEVFATAGYRTMVVSGDSDDRERQAAIDGLANGTIDVVMNCQLWIAGVDCPAISCVILLTPTKSLPRFLQSVGRGLRLNDLFEDLIVIDHANNFEEHGSPTDDREWHLAYGDDRIAKPKDPDEVPIKRCPKCFAMERSTARMCSICGHEFEPEGRVIEVVEGELEEIDLEAIRKEKKMEEWKCRSFEDFVALGAARGHKPGWAEHRWKAKMAKNAKVLHDRYGQLFDRS